MTRIAKPQLRGFVHDAVKRSIAQATVFSFFCTGMVYQFYCKPRLEKVENFYKTYDADADYKRMLRNGLIRSEDDDE